MKVIPHASETQIRETRWAFYAGAVAMFASTNEVAVEAGDDEKAGEAAIDEIVKELENFPDRVKEGAA